MYWHKAVGSIAVVQYQSSRQGLPNIPVGTLLASYFLHRWPTRRQPAGQYSVEGKRRFVAAGRKQGVARAAPNSGTLVMFIVLYACLISAPATCREEKLSFSLEASAPMTCMMSSQQAIAQWSESHPQWQIGRWKCVAADRLMRDI